VIGGIGFRWFSGDKQSETCAVCVWCKRLYHDHAQCVFGVSGSIRIMRSGSFGVGGSIWIMRNVCLVLAALSGSCAVGVWCWRLYLDYAQCVFGVSGPASYTIIVSCVEIYAH